MFPFQRSCELSFKLNDDDDNNNHPYDQYNIKHEILLDDNNNNDDLLGNNLDRVRGRGRGRGRGRSRRAVGSSSNTNNSNNNSNTGDEEEKKRVFHRESERQRRQEMSTLFDSLRSVIPAHHLKGRSITDNLGEATNYIKDLEKNVKELGEKRDELKKSIRSTTSSSNRELGGSSNSSPPYNVVIRQFTGGLEIEICVKYDDAQFLLSTALHVVFEEGLEVVSSTSTKFHERFIHSVQCEVTSQFTNIHVITNPQSTLVTVV
ncbi:hypothetical protein RND81_12G118900 [Saponaria officinalis]|uniref:BHLH domain-containing protein n=1 Tax=Saponaria officinalis TaxID=3572 RepID=A0AAW1H9I4_SAPOF